MREVVRQMSAALRSLSRQPAVMLPAVLTLALGIGANTALFAYLAYILWPTIDAPEPARVVWVYSGIEEEPRMATSYPELQDIERGQTAVTDIVATSRFGASIAHGEQTSFAWGHLVSGDYFSFFAARPAAGRLLQPGDDRPDAPPVVVLGHRFWRGKLGANPDVVGRELRINGIGMTVVGVTSEGFQGEGLASAVYVPLLQSDRVTAVPRIDSRDPRWLNVLGRLAPGTSEERARAALQVLGKSLDAAHPLPEGETRSIDLIGATRYDAAYDDGGNFVGAARILMAVASVFLLLGCASIANLLLARAISKQREWGIRASLGASRSWLIGGVLAESAVLCLVGGLAGLAVASVLENRIETYITTAPGGLGNWAEGTEQLQLDARVIGFALLVTALCAALGALGPVLKVLRGDLLGPLKSDASASGSGGGLAPRKLLVVLQVSLSVLLLLGGGLLYRTLDSARRVDPGFDPDGLLLATINVPRNVSNQAGGGGEIFRRVMEEARATPGVSSASLVHVAPLSGWSKKASIAGGSRPDKPLEVDYNSVAPDYFRTVGIGIVAGRPLDGRDRKDSAPAVVVSRELARRLWGEGAAASPEGAVGQLVRLEDPQSSENLDRPFAVVGVAEDIRNSAIEAPGPMVYLSFEQRTHPRMTLVVRSASPEVPMAALAPQLGRALREAHPDLAIVDLLSCREQMKRSLVQQQMYAEIAGLFALLGLAVAVIGLFGLLSYTVSLRRREFGIRMAIGAEPRDVRRLVVRQGMALVGLGVAAGVVASLALSRVLAGLLFGVGATDPLTFLSIPAVLALVSLLACWFPARKAARIHPTVAIKGA